MELATLEDAISVKTTLDGLNIYPGANTLKVTFGFRYMSYIAAY